MNIYHYGFVCLVNFLEEKYIRVKKKTFIEKKNEKKQISGICELFANISHLTNNIPICTFWSSRTIPIPYKSWLRKSIPFSIRGINYYLLITVCGLKKCDFEGGSSYKNHPVEENRKNCQKGPKPAKFIFTGVQPTDFLPRVWPTTNSFVIF